MVYVDAAKAVINLVYPACKQNRLLKFMSMPLDMVSLLRAQWLNG